MPRDRVDDRAAVPIRHDPEQIDQAWTAPDDAWPGPTSSSLHVASLIAAIGAGILAAGVGHLLPSMR